MAPKTILHNLSLLFHSVRMEGLAGFGAVLVGIRADPQLPMQHMTELSCESSGEVHCGAPSLILRAVRQFVRQRRKVAMAVSREKDMVAEGDGAIAAEPQDEAPEQPGKPSGGGPI
jgi:hypothetical protein